MKKLLLAVALIGSSTAAVVAQETEMKTTNTTFSIAGNVGSGRGGGNNNQDFKLSAGGDIQAEFPATTGLKITASAGYQNFAFEDRTGGGNRKDHISFIPVLAGAKVAFGKGLYGHGQLGYSFLTVKNSASNSDNGNFTFAPSLGYGFGKNLDISAKYLSINKINAVLARLAYNF
jgi:hypothetical protein